MKNNYSFPRVVKSRSLSARDLSVAAIGHSLKSGESIFTGYRFDLGSVDNEIALSQLREELVAIKACPVKLVARFEGDANTTLPFYCAKLHSLAALESMLRRYRQKAAVRMIEGEFKGYHADDCQDIWYSLGKNNPGPEQIISYFRGHFGPRIYFDYPAQKMSEKAYELFVVQKPPIWSRAETCSQQG